MMLEFVECWDRFNQLFYSVEVNKNETILVYFGGEWIMESPEGHGCSQYSQKDLKQILDKMVELNGGED